MKTNLPRLMLAAPASGSGKTTLTIALLAALKSRGHFPAAFKCGPDYIDPMFHREVLGMQGYNLDLFFTPPDIVRGLLAHGAKSAGIAVLEGVMGYYDGAGMTSDASSWHVASETQTPTVLVVRPGGASLSVAALVKGFATFKENSQIKGVLLNDCTPAMADRLATLIERECGVRVYGCMPQMPQAKIESRHLGLVTPDGVANLRENVQQLAVQLKESADIDGLVALAATAPPLEAALPPIQPVVQGVRIAVAQDEAFCFYYRENLELLEALGTELVSFSPLRDENLPQGVSALYIGGGYPELCAKTLSDNTAMRASLKQALGDGLPAIAECGGFLYLGQRLEDENGTSYSMVGALEGDGFNARKLGRFGYVGLAANEDNLLCRRGETIKGHEFHYWDSTCPGEGFTAQKPHSQRQWPCVQTSNVLYAGFPHLYFWSNPECAAHFVRAAANYTGRKKP